MPDLEPPFGFAFEMIADRALLDHEPEQWIFSCRIDFDHYPGSAVLGFGVIRILDLFSFAFLGTRQYIAWTVYDFTITRHEYGKVIIDLNLYWTGSAVWKP